HSPSASCRVRTCFSVRTRRAPRPTLFPYTTLFRSRSRRASRDAGWSRNTRSGCTRPRSNEGPSRDPDFGTHAATCLELTLQGARSEEHTSELQSLRHLVCRLLLEKKKNRHTP